jgi:DNA-binding IclR family transcriptional regulator
MSGLPAQPVQGLIEGLAVLRALAMRSDPVSGKVLAAELDLNTTRVNRLLKTLAHLGLAHRTRSRRYTGGPGMHVLAAQALFGSGVIRAALPHLEALGRTNKIVALGVLWRDQVSYLYFHVPGRPPLEALGRAALFPATKSSIGMVLLAEWSDEEVRALFKGRALPGRPGGIRGLLRDLRAIRRQGFAEVKLGSHTMAVKVGKPAFAGIALSGRTPAKDVPNQVALLQEKAALIEQGLQKEKQT